MLKLKTFIKDSIEEMRDRVTWPTYKELQSNSVLVLVGCLVFAVIIGLIDLSFKNVMDLFYGSF
ncbi:preprotein translocase subunit SecE [Aureibacter tunicatorum]|uniref:Protein translocase subunit SecE n=1 Tax=Aureibacter tunicatorum TaxID=866807 RepID=A0AAE3XJT6_9BACT|nr:preprotein translocase subunit SecE [Aureibacter tunicatorum]MDR6237948.1 preprotein translocase subunit SecE [Aureibacter tunicatorum]BDD02981.1 hypothetical protein AUTU_04640 [Aureibacter tunicatorum]